MLRGVLIFTHIYTHKYKLVNPILYVWSRSYTAVKPAAVQKNTVKPAAIEKCARVLQDYGNHRNNTEERRALERFSSGRPELKYNEIFAIFFLYIA